MTMPKIQEKSGFRLGRLLLLGTRLRYGFGMGVGWSESSGSEELEVTGQGQGIGPRRRMLMRSEKTATVVESRNSDSTIPATPPALAGYAAEIDEAGGATGTTDLPSGGESLATLLELDHDDDGAKLGLKIHAGPEHGATTTGNTTEEVIEVLRRAVPCQIGVEELAKGLGGVAFATVDAQAVAADLSTFGKVWNCKTCVVTLTSIARNPASQKAAFSQALAENKLKLNLKLNYGCAACEEKNGAVLWVAKEMVAERPYACAACPSQCASCSVNAIDSNHFHCNIRDPTKLPLVETYKCGLVEQTKHTWGNDGSDDMKKVEYETTCDFPKQYPSYSGEASTEEPSTGNALAVAEPPKEGTTWKAVDFSISCHAGGAALAERLGGLASTVHVDMLAKTLSKFAGPRNCRTCNVVILASQAISDSEGLLTRSVKKQPAVNIDLDLQFGCVACEERNGPVGWAVQGASTPDMLYACLPCDDACASCSVERRPKLLAGHSKCVLKRPENLPPASAYTCQAATQMQHTVGKQDSESVSYEVWCRLPKVYPIHDEMGPSAASGAAAISIPYTTAMALPLSPT